MLGVMGKARRVLRHKLRTQRLAQEKGKNEERD